MVEQVGTPSPEQLRVFTAARLNAAEYAPYLARALWQLRPLAAPGLGTAAVDRHWRLYLDFDTLAGWGPQASGAVLVHEVGHLIRDHAGRADALGAGRNHLAWNYATDAAINDDLCAAGLPLPTGAVTPQALGLAPGGIEETYYAAITSTTPDDPDGGGRVRRR